MSAIQTTELIKACKEGDENTVSLAITQGAELNIKHERSTPLNAAISGHHEGVIKLLIEAKADLHFPEKETPILYATYFGNINVLNTLLSNGANPNDNDAGNTSVISIACQRTNAEFIERLIEAGALIDDTQQAWSALIHAAYKGKTDIVALLLNKQINIESVTPNGQTALMLAAQEGHSDCVKLLLEAGANPDTGVGKKHSLFGGGLNASPLNRATYSGHLEVVQLLLANGANPNTPGEKDGKNALHISALEQHYEVAKALITAGVDPKQPDGYGSTIHSLAKENGVLAELKKELNV